MIIAENILMACLLGLSTLIFVRMLIEFVTSMSQIRLDKSNFIYKFLYDFTEPFYKPFRKVLPPAIHLDMSPLFALMFIYTLISILGKFFKIINNVMI